MTLATTARHLMATALLSALLAGPSAGSEQKTTTHRGFNWFANAAGTGTATRTEAIVRAKQAVRKAQVVNRGATWVCSPAGFGQPSRCYRA